MIYSDYDVEVLPQNEFNYISFAEIDPWAAPENVQKVIDEGRQTIFEIRDNSRKVYGSDLAAVGEILSDWGNDLSNGWRQVVTGERVKAQRDFRTFKAETLEDFKRISRTLGRGSKSVRFYARR